MGKYIKCIAKRYDAEKDIIWGKFETEDHIDKIEFEIPINDGDFELCKKYTIKFDNYNPIDHPGNH